MLTEHQGDPCYFNVNDFSVSLRAKIDTPIRNQKITSNSHGPQRTHVNAKKETISYLMCAM